MSDEIRKDGVAPEGESQASGGAPSHDPGTTELPHREEVMPKDHEVYTPQGGGAGTGSGPIQEVAAVGEKPARLPSKDGDAVTLPQVGPEVATAEALGLAEDTAGGAGPASGPVSGPVPGSAGVPGRPEVSSFRLLMTLGVAGAIAGALLVFVFLWSEPLIQAENARILREAVTEVLKGPSNFESVFLHEGELITQVPEGVDTLNLDKVFLGYDEAGNPMGFAVEADGFGFQDIIRVIFGYDAETGQVLGMKVLSQKETPGLGNKIEEAEFVSEFDGVDTPLEGVKPDRNTGDSHQVDMITGVTISSKAVIRIINDRLAGTVPLPDGPITLGDLLAAYEPDGAGSAGASPEGQEEGR